MTDTTETTQSQMINLKTAAEILGLTVRQAEFYRASGKLPPADLTIGRNQRWLRAGFVERVIELNERR